MGLINFVVTRSAASAPKRRKGEELVGWLEDRVESEVAHGADGKGKTDREP
jgi:hypothetical protein